MWFAWLSSVISATVVMLVAIVVLLIFFPALIRGGRFPVFRILLDHRRVVIGRGVVKVHSFTDGEACTTFIETPRGPST
jgi:hypothetical protein